MTIVLSRTPKKPIEVEDTVIIKAVQSNKMNHHIANREVLPYDMDVSACGSEFSGYEIPVERLPEFNICPACKKTRFYKEQIKPILEDMSQKGGSE